MGASRPRARGESTEAIAEGAWLLSRLAIMVSSNCNETGLTLQQYRMLLKIVDQPMRASALARASGTSRATLSAMIRNMEQRGLVKRSAVEEDLRGVAVEITTTGRAAVRKADERMARLFVSLARSIGVDELFDVMEELRDPIDEESSAYKERALRGGNNRA